MDSQYYSPQQPSLPLGCSYDEDEDVQFSTQSPSTLRLFTPSFDHPPRSTPQQQFQSSKPSSSNFLSEQQFSFSPHLSMSQSTPLWNNSLPSYPSAGLNPQSLRRGEEYSFTPTSSYITTADNDIFSGSEIPRGWEGYSPRLLEGRQNRNFTHFEAMNYNNEANKTEDFYYHQQDNSVYQSLENPRDFTSISTINNEDYVPRPSQYPSLESLQFNTKGCASRVPSCDASDDGDGITSREMTAVEGDELGIEEPYAKLIYRALMSKPDHSMILQDIYQWFRENTNKGSSDSKGWMNSIRHNLSMNAAFKKTERKVPGDESKKSTEWVLEDFAIKDGVQSTTRYRKGAANKKFIRSGTPAPSRQRSGQKGGMSTRNSARLRRGDDQFRRSRLDTGGSMRGFPGHLQRMGMEERQREPLTPPHNELLSSQSSGTYYGFHAPAAKIDQPYDLGFEMCGLEGVQGVHMDGGPVFASDLEMGYHSNFQGPPSYDNRS